MKAKTCSLIAKVAAAIIAIGGHLLMWFGIMPNARSSEILSLAAVIASLFVTVDANIALDKFTSTGDNNGK